MKAERSLSSRLSRCIKASIRALRRARDIYVRSMTDCASRIDYGAAAIAWPAAVVHTLPRNYTSNSMFWRSENDEIRELLREATSAQDSKQKKKKKKKKKSTTTTPPTSKGVVVNGVSMEIGRIDEDKPCYFPNDFKVGSAKPPSYSRSKSFAATATARRPRMDGSFA